MNVPILETERLVLRGHRMDDLDELAAMWADPAVTRFITGRPSSKQQSWSRLMAYVGHWELLGFGYWAIEEREAGRYAGQLGFADFKRALDPQYAGVPELGFVLATRTHGRGYATEAVRAALAWGDAHLPSARTIALIDPENRASIRVTEKNGYRQLASTRDENGPVLIVGRER